MAESSTQTHPISSNDASKAILEARPPATDRFTYLTLIEETLSPDVLPALHDVLQDARLTQDIGWDLVEMLVPLLPVSEACLDDVARLGNPREVILKVLEALEVLKTNRGSKLKGSEVDGEEEEGEEEEHSAANGDDKEDQKTAEATTRSFIVLLGMLSILYRRIKTRYPSRFLETILRTILAAYRPERPAMTTAVLGLVRSLSAHKRPLPPMRRSESRLVSLSLTSNDVLTAVSGKGKEEEASSQRGSPPGPGNLVRQSSAIGQVARNNDQTDESAVSVPDPEAEDLVDPAEGAVQQRLLQSFVTCILEAYVNANEMAWAPRLLETYHPEKTVPGRPTAHQSYRDDPELEARDSAVGKLVALALDLGLKYSDSFVASASKGPLQRNPFAGLDLKNATHGTHGPAGIPLSTGGTICLMAYWVFSAAVFNADAPVPNMYIFPEHHAMLDVFLGEVAAAQVPRSPGTVEALVTIGMWLNRNGSYTAPAASANGSEAATAQSLYMPYHHLLTLCSMFHPSLAVRNATTFLAGEVLHADPDPEDRLKILQDLLENCIFATLKACAVTWLREELLLVNPSAAGNTPFATMEAVELLQYAIFPDLQALQEEAMATVAEDEAMAVLLDYWMQNGPFLLQAANFAYFLFRSERFRATVVPPGMGPAIGQRYVEPLVQAATKLRNKLAEDDDSGNSKPDKAELEHVLLDLEVLASRLQSLELS